VRWLDTRLREIEKRHRLDEKSAAMLRAMAVKRFSKYTKAAGGLLLNPRSGTLRRAHSEELVSEVGADVNNNNNGREEVNGHDEEDANAYEGVEVMPDFFAAKLRTRKRRENGEEGQRPESGGSNDEPGYRALTVSDRPRVGRIRRNSAGDEPLSLLDDHDGEARQGGGELQDLERRFRELSAPGSRPAEYSPYGSGGVAAGWQHRDGRHASLSPLDDTPSSSGLDASRAGVLNVSDFSPTVILPPPAQHADDGRRSPSAMGSGRAVGDLIRPIPGRPPPRDAAREAPPLPGPKPPRPPNFQQLQRDNALMPPPLSSCSAGVNRQLFPPKTGQYVEHQVFFQHQESQPQQPHRIHNALGLSKSNANTLPIIGCGGYNVGSGKPLKPLRKFYTSNCMNGKALFYLKPAPFVPQNCMDGKA
jgi:hypothetical protein